MVSRAKKLCCPNKLREEVRCIEKFAAFNGFPKWIAKKIVQQTMNSRESRPKTTVDNVETLYMFLPYNGKHAEAIVQRCKNRLIKSFKREKKVKFEVCFQSTKIAFFTSNKDQIPLLSNSGVIYQFNCPGCDKTYIGKTDNTLFNRTKQHGWSQKDSAVRKHFSCCEGWKHIVDISQLGGEEIDQMPFQINAVRENTKIVGRSKNWLTLAFRESLAIKHFKPELNKGLKSCKELRLF